jgi:hypothetical protein
VKIRLFKGKIEERWLRYELVAGGAKIIALRALNPRTEKPYSGQTPSKPEITSCKLRMKHPNSHDKRE